MYRVYIVKDGDFGYIAHCPAMPDCQSEGKTIEEALDNIKDAIIGYLELSDESLLEETKRKRLVMDVRFSV